MFLPPTLRGHRRSASAPPAPIPKPPSASSLASSLSAKPSCTTDLEMQAYSSGRQRAAIQTLSSAYSEDNSNMVGSALHYHGLRHTTLLRSFIEAARDYDQELLDLRFKLAGPNYIAYVSAADAEKALASLRRADEILARGGWRVRKSEDLWAAHLVRPASGTVIWNPELNKGVDSGKLDAELACHRFWEGAKKGFPKVLGEMKKEAKCMKGIASGIEQNRELPFVRELRQKSKKAYGPPGESVHTSTNTLSSGGLHQMSGALPVADADADATKATMWTSSLKAKLEKTKSSNPLGVDFPVLALKTRYQFLKAQDKLRGGKNLEASRDAWIAFRESLENRPGPPSTDVILLTYKVNTRIFLLEQGIQSSEDESRADGDKQSKGQAEGDED